MSKLRMCSLERADMAIGVEILDTVHCHVCPLKDLCPYGKPVESWRQRNYEYAQGQAEVDWKDWTAVKQATINCPLRGLIWRYR